MIDQNKTIARTIRMYPHEWEQIEKRLRALNKNLKGGSIGINRFLAVLAAEDAIKRWYDAEDILSHTEDARAKDVKRRKRAV